MDETENPRMVRLMSKISHLNIDIRYIKGEENSAADFL